MLTVGEWVDKTNEIANVLENEASRRKATEMARINAYHEGYIQACEDYNRRMIHAIQENQG